MKNIFFTAAFILACAYAPAQVSPQKVPKNAKRDTVAAHQTAGKKAVKTKDQTKVIRNNTSVKSDSVIKRTENP